MFSKRTTKSPTDMRFFCSAQNLACVLFRRFGTRIFSVWKCFSAGLSPYVNFPVRRFDGIGIFQCRNFHYYQGIHYIYPLPYKYPLVFRISEIFTKGISKELYTSSLLLFSKIVPKGGGVIYNECL